MSPEKELHSAVCRSLNGYQSHGLLRYTATKREAVRGLKWGKQAQQTGFAAGLPDFIIFTRSGQTIFIELKAPKTGRLSEKQEQWRDWLSDCGFQWHEACYLKDVQAIVDAALGVMK